MSIDIQGGDRLVRDNLAASKMTEGQDCTWFGWAHVRGGGGLRNMHGQQNSGGKENIYRFNSNNFQGGSWGSDEFYNYGTSPAERAKMTMYVATYAGTWRSYVDGVFVGEDATAPNGPRNVATAWRIGAEAGGGRQRDGWLADARVYGRALSEAEILSAYTMRGLDGIVDGLVWRLRLAEGAVDLHEQRTRRRRARATKPLAGTRRRRRSRKRGARRCPRSEQWSGRELANV